MNAKSALPVLPRAVLTNSNNPLYTQPLKILPALPLSLPFSLPPVLLSFSPSFLNICIGETLVGFCPLNKVSLNCGCLQLTFFNLGITPNTYISIRSLILSLSLNKYISVLFIYIKYNSNTSTKTYSKSYVQLSTNSTLQLIKFLKSASQTLFTQITWSCLGGLRLHVSNKLPVRASAASPWAMLHGERPQVLSFWAWLTWNCKLEGWAHWPLQSCDSWFFLRSVLFPPPLYFPLLYWVPPATTIFL